MPDPIRATPYCRDTWPIAAAMIQYPNILPKGRSVQDQAPEGGAGTLADVLDFSAAAEASLPLDEVERLANRAKARTASFGGAFSGSTLPGAAGPLFTVPEGRMAVGLGHPDAGAASMARCASVVAGRRAGPGGAP